MADTIRTKAALQTAMTLGVGAPASLPDQTLRDFLVTALNGAAAAAVADGGTIAHGCGATPTRLSVIGSVANEIVAVTGLDATNITVAIKKRVDGSAGTAQTIYWMAS